MKIIEFIKKYFGIIKDFVIKHKTLSIVILTIIGTMIAMLMIRGCK